MVLIYKDIKREIDLACDGDAGGRFLAALGLISYTEFMGRLALKNKESYTKQFKVFFSSMGESYKQLVEDKEIDVYRLSRSGLVTAYLSGELDIKMLNSESPAGLLVKDDGTYLVVVEKYFEDFTNACHRLYEWMLKDPEAEIP